MLGIVMTGAKPDPGALRARVRAMVDSVLRPDEVDVLEITHEGDRIVLRLDAQEESMSFLLWERGLDVMAQLEHLAAGLEDFIAESGFAWGQERMVPTHLYEFDLDEAAP